MTNDERNPKPECRRALRGAIAGFVIRISVFLRISSFVIRIWEFGLCKASFRFLRLHWGHEPIPGDSTCLESRLHAVRTGQSRDSERSVHIRLPASVAKLLPRYNTPLTLANL